MSQQFAREARLPTSTGWVRSEDLQPSFRKPRSPGEELGGHFARVARTGYKKSTLFQKRTV